MDTSAVIEAEAPVIDAPAAAPEAPTNDTKPAEAPAEKEAELSDDDRLDQDLRKAFRERQRSRDDRGKFAPKDGKPAEAKDANAETVEETVTEVSPEPAKPAVQMPPSWSKDKAERWAKLDPDTQADLAAREHQVHQAISNYGRQLKQAEPIMRVVQENADVFRANNIDPAQGIAALVQAQKVLDRNPMQGIANIAQMYGIDLRAMVGQMYGQPAEHADEGFNPHIAQLQQELSQTRRELEQWKSQQAAEREAATAAQHESQVESLVREINEFANDKPDFDEVQGEVMSYVQYLMQSSPGLSTRDMLSQAYERATWANPKTREARQKAAAAQRLQDAAKQAESAKRAAQINVKGERPSSNQVQDLDQLLRSTYRQINRQ